MVPVAGERQRGNMTFDARARLPRGDPVWNQASSFVLDVLQRDLEQPPQARTAVLEMYRVPGGSMRTGVDQRTVSIPQVARQGRRAPSPDAPTG
jgi:hypothetical protein